jgi:HD-GYP domain-containing protein (c-di-GMP phosphodiesterase class II)
MTRVCYAERVSGRKDCLVTAKAAQARLLATVEGRYQSVAAHIARMSRYTEAIALRLGLDAHGARLLRGASKLHDIGKLAIPDRILLKPARLTARERTIIERHAPIGYELLADSGSELLDIAAAIALSHHEHWDGSGYPQGLRGDEIPLEARIAAVADVFDSLTRVRSYRPAFKFAEAFELVRHCCGTQFDPDVVEAFLAAQPEIRRLRRRAG